MNSTTLTRWSLRLASLLACLALWQVLSARHVDLGLVTFANVPGPRDVLDAAWSLAQSSKLGRHLGSSLLRIGRIRDAAVAHSGGRHAPGSPVDPRAVELFVEIGRRSHG